MERKSHVKSDRPWRVITVDSCHESCVSVTDSQCTIVSRIIEDCANPLIITQNVSNKFIEVSHFFVKNGLNGKEILQIDVELIHIIELLLVSCI